MHKNFASQINTYWKKLNKEKLLMFLSITLFRILKQYQIEINKKNILDIGFGEGKNLLECKRRGANVYGIELREKKIKEMNLNFKINKKIFLEQT